MARNALYGVGMRLRAAELYDEGHGRASIAAYEMGLRQELELCTRSRFPFRLPISIALGGVGRSAAVGPRLHCLAPGAEAPVAGFGGGI